MSSKPSSSRALASHGPVVSIITLAVCLLAALAFGVSRLQQAEENYYKRGTVSAQVRMAALPPAPAAKVEQAAMIGDPRHGKDLFAASCSLCHGPTGAGIPNLGVTLRESKFVATQSDEQLGAFLKVGRKPGDAQSVHNGRMPARGSNPFLEDDSLQDIVAFLRVLQMDAHLATAGGTAAGQ